MVESVNELAAMIHREACADVPKCARGESHRQYYRDRAAKLIERLEPEIGLANVSLAVQVVMDELWRSGDVPSRPPRSPVTPHRP